MAKVENTFSVRGKSISQLKSLTPRFLESQTTSDISKVVSRLSSAANKRIKRLIESRVPSQALSVWAEKGAYKFSTKGKNKEMLLEEYKRVKNFLELESSTVKGARLVRKRTIDGAKEKGVIITEKDYDMFFRTYEELKKVDPSIQDKLYKYNVWGELAQQVKTGASMPDIILKMLENLSSIYEKRFDADTDFSEFFEF